MANHIEEKPTESLLQTICAKSYDVFEDGLECVAGWPLGQSVLKSTDKFLWILEKCAEWSVPNTTTVAKQTESNGTFGKPLPLIRPLPWLIFLPLLILMRVSRIGVNVGAFILGLESVKPENVVQFIQLRRRRVRALKFLGLKQMRYRKMYKEQQQEEESSQETWKQKIYNSVTSAICLRQNHLNDVSEKITVQHAEGEPQQTNSKTTSGADLKRKYIEILKSDISEWEDIEDDEILQQIDKLAEECDEDDADFIAADAESSTSDEDSMSEPEDNVDPISNNSHILHRPPSKNSLTNETIREENEDSDSDSTTVSANSGDESSQQITPNDTDKTNKNSPAKVVPVANNNKIENNVHLTDSAVTSDEYYSPQNSITVTPEPPKEVVQNQTNSTFEKDISTSNESTPTKLNTKEETEHFINSEKKVTSANNGIRTNSTTSTNSHRGYGKKHKNRRKFSNLLRRKRK